MESDRVVNEDTEKAYALLVTLIEKLGWSIAMPTGGGPEDDGLVHGMIIGEEPYIDYILKHLE